MFPGQRDGDQRAAAWCRVQAAFALARGVPEGACGIRVLLAGLPAADGISFGRGDQAAAASSGGEQAGAVELPAELLPSVVDRAGLSGAAGTDQRLHGIGGERSRPGFEEPQRVALVGQWGEVLSACAASPCASASWPSTQRLCIGKMPSDCAPDRQTACRQVGGELHVAFRRGDVRADVQSEAKGL